MLGGTNTQIVASEIQELSDAAWNEFTATSPQGIDLVAEASVRRLMAESHPTRCHTRRARPKSASKRRIVWIVMHRSSRFGRCHAHRPK